MSAGQRPEKLGYSDSRQSAGKLYQAMVPRERSSTIGQVCASPLNSILSGTRSQWIQANTSETIKGRSR